MTGKQFGVKTSVLLLNLDIAVLVSRAATDFTFPMNIRSSDLEHHPSKPPHFSK